MTPLTSPSPVADVRDDLPDTPDTSFFAGRSWLWTSGPCRALGHSFAVDVEGAEIFARRLAPLLETYAADVPAAVRYRFVVRRGTAEPRFGLYYDDTLVTAGSEPFYLVATLLWHINQEVVRLTSSSRVLLHSAAAERDGVVVLLPAPMEAGKTTTVAGLLRHGYRYLTDEAVALDPRTLRVDPFPKPLSLDAGSWPVLAELRPPYAEDTDSQWHVPPKAFGQQVLASAGRPRLVVFPRYVAGARTVCSPVAAGECVELLARSTFEFSARPRRNLAVLGEIAESCARYRLTIGELSAAVRVIDDLVTEQT